MTDRERAQQLREEARIETDLQHAYVAGVAQGLDLSGQGIDDEALTATVRAGFRDWLHEECRCLDYPDE